MSNRPNRKPSSTNRVQQAQRGSRARLWIGLAVVVVLAAGIIAVVVSSGEDGEVTVGDVRTEDAIAHGSPSVAGEPLPEPAGGADPAIGMAAPDVVGQAFDGSELVIDPADGRPKVIVFLAHWCSHCQAEVPRLVDWLEAEGMPEDVDLYGVATSTTSTRGNFPPARWLSREGWPVPTVVDDEQGTIAAAHGLAGFPFFVAVDDEGTVVQRASGELTMDQFEALVDMARAGSGGGGGDGGPAVPPEG